MPHLLELMLVKAHVPVTAAVRIWLKPEPVGHGEPTRRKSSKVPEREREREREGKVCNFKGQIFYR